MGLLVPRICIRLSTAVAIATVLAGIAEPYGRGVSDQPRVRLAESPEAIYAWLEVQWFRHRCTMKRRTKVIIIPIPLRKSASSRSRFRAHKVAQGRVEHGLALMHSFLFDDGAGQFKAAAAEDSTCAMAYWAEAIGLYRPLAYPPSDDDMKAGWDLIQKAGHSSPRPSENKTT